MKTFKFHTVTPLFTEDLDFVVDNVRRVRRETGLNCIAFSLSMHPQGTPAAARAESPAGDGRRRTTTTSKPTAPPRRQAL